MKILIPDVDHTVKKMRDQCPLKLVKFTTVSPEDRNYGW